MTPSPSALYVVCNLVQLQLFLSHSYIDYNSNSGFCFYQLQLRCLLCDSQGFLLTFREFEKQHVKSKPKYPIK